MLISSYREMVQGTRNEERCGVWCVAAGCSASVRSACLQLMGPARNIEITTSITTRLDIPAREALLYFREQVTDT